MTDILRRTLRGATTAILLLAVGSSVVAAPAGPTDIGRALASAKSGGVVVLRPGDYGPLSLTKVAFSPRLTIDATAARFSSITLRRVSGVEIKGGTVAGDPADHFAVAVDFASDVRIAGMKIGGAKVGVAVSRSDHVQVADNVFEGVRSDGVNVAMSHHVDIERNICRNFRPIQAVYDAAGTRLRDGDHPDCVQGWSIRTADPTRDISIIGNRAEGFMQGVFFGNPNSGGYDRIVVRNNVMTLSAFNGIVIKEVRGADVSGNVINTVPGAVLPKFPHPPIKTWIRITGSDLRVCGNTVGAWPNGEGTGKCPAKAR